MKTPLKFAAPLMALAALATAPAMAGEKSSLVQFNDLDLTSAAGQQTFDRRISSAVRKVCETPRAFTLTERMDVRRCKAEAMSDAKSQAVRAIAAAQSKARLARSASPIVAGN